jgi:hypothetical protein
MAATIFIKSSRSARALARLSDDPEFGSILMRWVAAVEVLPPKAVLRIPEAELRGWSDRRRH